MQYLTYEEYTEIGGTLDLTAFKRNIDRVCGIIDSYTHNRLHCMNDIPQQVKVCVRDLAEYVANNSNGKTISSKSQSSGGVSESESYVTKTLEETKAEIENIIYDYLSSITDNFCVPLLYRGCSR